MIVEQIEADVLVAGGGMGGLMAATRAHLAGARVVLLSGLPGASVRMAGFATALLDDPQDRPEYLFNDVFIAGGFVNHPRVVAAMADRIGPETRFFEELGVPFERRGGRLARRQAAGVTWPRAVYTTGMVGQDAGRRLLDRLREAGSPPVWVLDRGLLMDLDVRDGAVCGGLAYVRSTKQWVHVVAPVVVVATGGVGRLYRCTTNFPGTNGMGYALALEAGTPLVDIEFVSFEPTVAVAPDKIARMEVPTMAFSEGARLLNGRGEEFVATMPPVSKDVMSRAILAEVRAGRGTPAGGVYYDLGQVPPEAAFSYSQIRRVLKALDASPAEARIEVCPTQHYLMGGIQADETAATAVPGLFAVGEAAGGAHGAHRLATCGGTEVIAMGAIAGEAAAAYAHARRRPGQPAEREPMPQLMEESLDAADAARLEELRGALEEGCGVLRDEDGLQKALGALTSLKDGLAAAGRMKTFLGRAALVANSLAEAALLRTESRGDHFRVDHPHRDDHRWLGNLVTRLGDDGATLETTFQPAGIGAWAAAPHPAPPS
jgi:succinate dehydrogenase/fumarate reductase flavoprotein subunit